MRQVAGLNAGDIRHDVMVNQMYSDAFPAVFDGVNPNDNVQVNGNGLFVPGGMYNRYLPQFF